MSDLQQAEARFRSGDYSKYEPERRVRDCDAYTLAQAYLDNKGSDMNDAQRRAKATDLVAKLIARARAEEQAMYSGHEQSDKARDLAQTTVDLIEWIMSL